MAAWIRSPTPWPSASGHPRPPLQCNTSAKFANHPANHSANHSSKFSCKSPVNHSTNPQQTTLQTTLWNIVNIVLQTTLYTTLQTPSKPPSKPICEPCFTLCNKPLCKPPCKVLCTPPPTAACQCSNASHVPAMQLLHSSCSTCVVCSLTHVVSNRVTSRRCDVRKEKKRKDFAFWCQFNEKPTVIPGCPRCDITHVKSGAWWFVQVVWVARAR